MTASANISVLPPDNEPLQPLVRQLLGILKHLCEVLADRLTQPPPIMVTREQAARMCGMCTETYRKYEKLQLVPRMNETGRVSVEAVRRACLKLDGIEHETTDHIDEAEAALIAFDRRRK